MNGMIIPARFIIGFVLFCAVAAAIIFIVFRIPRNSLVVKNQPAGRNIMVTSLTTTAGGFLVVLKANKYNKRGTEVAGHLHYLFPGTYHNISLNTVPDQQGKSSIGETVRGMLYFAVFYEDNDRTYFLSSNDRMMKDIFGREIVVPFVTK